MIILKEGCNLFVKFCLCPVLNCNLKFHFTLIFRKKKSFTKLIFMKNMELWFIFIKAGSETSVKILQITPNLHTNLIK